jgi:Alpha-L-arabinofuranosidase B, catalytic
MNRCPLLICMALFAFGAVASCGVSDLKVTGSGDAGTNAEGGLSGGAKNSSGTGGLVATGARGGTPGMPGGTGESGDSGAISGGSGTTDGGSDSTSGRAGASNGGSTVTNGGTGVENGGSGAKGDAGSGGSSGSKGGAGSGGSSGSKGGAGSGGSSGSKGGAGSGGAGCPDLQCGGTCFDSKTSNVNCGTCGHACTSEQTCKSGSCACTVAGLVQCAGSTACIDTNTSLTNCGGCGHTCNTGQLCSSGTCQAPPVCDPLLAAGNPCVAAYSTTRLLVSGYTGPLYQLCKGTATDGPSSCKGTTQDVGSKNGYADSATHDTFCSGASCTITKIYDQSGKKNDLEPAPKGGAKSTPDSPAPASALGITLNGHAVYGIQIKPSIGYRTGCSGCNIKLGNGTALGDTAESKYMVSSQKDLVDGCCYEYGNVETTGNDDGSGSAEAVHFGAGVVWGTGAGGKPGPWVEADLENGLYAGWENGQDKAISTNTPLKYDFVTAILVGDTADKNAGKGRFALYGGDATTGTAATMYDGIRPAKAGYVPMKKQGGIVLGIGGDNSSSGAGRFYEGVISSGAWSRATVNAVQANIVSARYGQ